MFGNVHMLPPHPQSRDLKPLVKAIRKGEVVCVPSHAGYALVCLADFRRSVRALEALSESSATLLLPSMEKVERVFGISADPSLKLLPDVLDRLEVEIRLPYHEQPAGVSARLLRLESPLKSLVEALDRPVMGVHLYGDVARGGVHSISRAWSEHIRLIADVDAPSSPRAPLRLVAMRAGYAVKAWGDYADERDQIASLLATRIHFVCQGNINRSAFAEARLRSYLREEAISAASMNADFLPAWEISSSGLIAMPGTAPPAAMLSASISYECEAILRDHQSTRFHPDLSNDVDMLVAMDQKILATLTSYELGDQIPRELRKINVPDPQGGEVRDFVQAAEMIDQLVSEHFLSRGCQLG